MKKYCLLLIVLLLLFSFTFVFAACGGAEPATTTSETTQKEMIVCSYCGEKNEQGSQFCFACGEDLDLQETVAECPACKHENKANAKFCTSCGERISQKLPAEKTESIETTGIPETNEDPTQNSDLNKVMNQGFFICGIMVYPPFNYIDGDGNLVGFDTDFANAVADYLGVEAKFRMIEWQEKYLELNNKSIDLIWNGFTYGNESNGVSRTEYVDFTHAYLENKQVVVTLTSRLGELNSKEALAGKTAAVKGGSSGEAVAIDFAGSEDKVAKFTAQSNALLEVKSGQAAFAVIDYQMAKAMVGNGNYTDLSINEAFDLGSEVYAIGARKGSDLTAKINEAIVALSKDGTVAAIAEKYGMADLLIPNIGQ